LKVFREQHVECPSPPAPLPEGDGVTREWNA
jgi:hypothetical protein